LTNIVTFGAAIRFNIAWLAASAGARSVPAEQLETFASWAFAFYYALQAFIAAKGSWSQNGWSYKGIGFATLGILGLAIVAFGTPVE
jgi:hypothetical protein